MSDERSGNKLPSVIRVLAIPAVLLLITCGCGRNSGDSTSKSAARTGNRTTISSCGSKGFEFGLHRVDCEVANAIVLMLNGRARHSTLTLTDDKGTHASWACVSQSIMGPLRCQMRSRFFVMKRKSG